MPKAPGPFHPAGPGEDWIDEAERTPRRREALEQVRRALEQDPGCPDARRLQILLDSAPPREKAVQLRALAECLAQEGAEIPARLRALVSLGRTLEQAGRTREAVPVLEHALSLAPGDPCGVRHHLARCLLNLHRLRELKELRSRYPEDQSALMAWIRLLEIQKSDRQAGIEQALRAARQGNPHMEDLLTSRRRLPRHLERAPDPEPGSLEEAYRIMEVIGEAWFSDRDALSWILRQQA